MKKTLDPLKEDLRKLDVIHIKTAADLDNVKQRLEAMSRKTDELNKLAVKEGELKKYSGIRELLTKLEKLKARREGMETVKDREKLAVMQKELTAKPGVMEEHSKSEKNLKEKEALKTAVEHDLKKQEKYLKELEDLEGGASCPRCGQTLTIEHLNNENPDGTFNSLHGQPEVDENIRQVCAMKYYPDDYFDYVLCIAEDYGNAGSIWESCAVDAGLDVDTIESCFDGEGKALLSENIKVGNEFGVGSSPTFMVNGKQQFGGTPPEGIKQNLCASNPGLEGCDVKLEGDSSNPAAAGGSC